MEIITIHVVLSILLFFIINWIGKHSYSIGYMEISIFVKTEEAPALNFLIRVLTPIVYLLIVSTLLYYMELDKFVENIFLVNIYYIIFRLLFNLLTNRGRLLNWYKQSLYWVAISIISYFTYIKLISVKTNILPDFSTLANELWIIILIFVFQVSNNVRFSQTGTEKRKNKYLTARYNKLKSMYGPIIQDITRNEVLEALTYSIMIYEDFNRPKVARIIENLKFKITKKPLTLGIMQVKSDKILSDKESVILGANKILTSYKDYLENIHHNQQEFYDWRAYDSIISNYNGGINYASEIQQLHGIIMDKFYKNTSDTLQPLNNNGL